MNSEIAQARYRMKQREKTPKMESPEPDKNPREGEIGDGDPPPVVPDMPKDSEESD